MGDHECRRGKGLDHVGQNNSFPLGLECGIKNELLSGGVLFVKLLCDVPRVGDELVGGGIVDRGEGVPRSSTWGNACEKWVTGQIRMRRTYPSGLVSVGLAPKFVSVGSISWNSSQTVSNSSFLMFRAYGVLELSHLPPCRGSRHGSDRGRGLLNAR